MKSVAEGDMKCCEHEASPCIFDAPMFPFHEMFIELSRNDSLPDLLRAVYEACSFSHAHAIGMEGARVAAATVHWIINQQQPAAVISNPEEASGNPVDVSRESGPGALLEQLEQNVVLTDDMRGKLQLIRKRMFQVSLTDAVARLCNDVFVFQNVAERA
jgi:ADP-ribosylglycohydrolase